MRRPDTRGALSISEQRAAWIEQGRCRDAGCDIEPEMSGQRCKRHSTSANKRQRRRKKKQMEAQAAEAARDARRLACAYTLGRVLGAARKMGWEIEYSCARGWPNLGPRSRQPWWSSAYLCNDYSRMVRVSDHHLPQDRRRPWSGWQIIVSPTTKPEEAIAKLKQITEEIENQ